MLKLLTAILAAATIVAGPALAQNSPAAQAVFDRAKQASGGAAWNRLAGWRESGQEAGGRYERWLDPLRYGLRVETEGPAGRLVQGYNGAGEWRILPNGVATGSVARDVIGRVRSEAFFGVQGYLYPSRFDLRSTLVGQREAQGRRFDVVRVQPAGGDPHELWFDRKTGLLARRVQVEVAKPLTVEIADYRKVGDLLVPHRFTIFGGDMAAPVERRIETVELKPVDRALFSLPRAEAPPPPRPAPASPPAPRPHRRR